MTKKQIAFLIIFIPFFILIFLYVSGFVAQIMSGHDIYTESDGFEIFSPPSLDFWFSIKFVFSSGYGLKSSAILLILLIILIIYITASNKSSTTFRDNERNFEYSTQGTYGTSNYMSDDEMKKVLDSSTNPKKTEGTIVGIKDNKILSIPIESRMNKNVAVFGASGTMKSRAYSRNKIFQSVKAGESLIITDPKSELYESMSEYLKNEGYIVKVLNLVNPENSDGWDCLGEIGDSEYMAQVFTEVIIKNTTSGKPDHFWDNSEGNLLKALSLFVISTYNDEQKNIGEVYDLLAISDNKKLSILFDSLPMSNPAKAPFNIYNQAGDTVKGGVIIGLGTRLQVFQSSIIKEITKHNDIDLTLPGKRKCAYFCITSDQDSTFDFLSSLFLTFVFIKLVRCADSEGINGALPVKVHILADELANIGVITDLTKKISTVRSRGISISVIFQSIAQMQNRYPNNQWAEIIGNCDTQLFLGCTDDITAKFISDRTGEVTIGVASEGKQLNSFRLNNYTPEIRQTKSTGKRKLLTPDEVLRLPLDEALVILRGQKVLKVKKFDYTKHPESRKLVDCKATNYYPVWRKNRTQKADIRVSENITAPVNSNTKKSNSVNLTKEPIKKATKKKIKEQSNATDILNDYVAKNNQVKNAENNLPAIQNIQDNPVEDIENAQDSSVTLASPENISDADKFKDAFFQNDDADADIEGGDADVDIQFEKVDKENLI